MIFDSTEALVDRCHFLFNFCTDETSERDISDGDDPRLSFFMFASIAGVSSSSSLTILPKYLNVLTLLIPSPH